MTICAKCKHSDFREPIWYSQFCKHPELARESGINPVTGMACYWSTNDLGRTVPTDDKYPYCRDINTRGTCDFYEEKP